MPGPVIETAKIKGPFYFDNFFSIKNNNKINLKPEPCPASANLELDNSVKVE